MGGKQGGDTIYELMEDEATYRWTLGQFVSRHELDIQVFALGLPSGLDQPLQNLDDKAGEDTTLQFH